MLFLADFNQLYINNASFCDDLVVLMVQGIMACFNGQRNDLLAEKVLNFYHMLEAKSCAALGVIAANMYGLSLRHVVHLQHKIAVVPIINFSEDMIRKLIQKNVDQVVASGQLNSVAISIAFDATSVPEAIQLSSHHNAILVGLLCTI